VGRAVGAKEVLEEVGADGGFEFRRLRKLTMQLCDEVRHLFLEGFAVAFGFLDADVTAGREDIIVGFDVLGRR